MKSCPKCGFVFKQLECCKCGLKWTPRSDSRPKVCPACKNYNWEEKE